MATNYLKTIDQFKAKLVGGGSRPNLFNVNLKFPGDAGLTTGENDSDQFLVKAAALPASNIGPIDVPFRGRILKVAGDRTFDTWTITILNDNSFALRGAFERWMNIIQRHEDGTGLTNPSDYMKDAFVWQLDRNGKALREYKFHDVFPTNISQMDLSYDSTDTIGEFTVELQVQWWEATGNGGDVGIPDTDEEGG